MNVSEAKEILQLYRPGGRDGEDRLIADALSLARRDSELDDWLAQHNAFQTALRGKFREIAVPSHLKETLLAGAAIITYRPWWRDPGWLRAAALVALFLGLCVWLAGVGNRARVPDRFADYEQRMVRSALREYRMDLLTDDLAAVRQLMAAQGAPADFSVPEGLSRLQLTGGGVLRWRNHPVAMVCFDRGDNEMLFLFVMDRSAVKDPPPVQPELANVSKLQTVTWTEGDKTYLLAGPEEAGFREKYF